MYREQLVGTAEADSSAASSSNKVLVVIPCLNERANIAKLVSATCADTAGLDRLIVVVDGGSTDGTLSTLADVTAREPCVRVISNPKRIQGAGVNLAVQTFGDGYHWL